MSANIGQILKSISEDYSISEQELIDKYMNKTEDIDMMPVPKIKEIIKNLGGDIKGKRKKTEWIELAKELIDKSNSNPDAESYLQCEIRRFGNIRCALHSESGRLFSIDNHTEIGMWDTDKGPIFFEYK